MATVKGPADQIDVRLVRTGHILTETGLSEIEVAHGSRCASPRVAAHASLCAPAPAARSAAPPVGARAPRPARRRRGHLPMVGTVYLQPQRMPTLHQVGDTVPLARP
jgi:hypothetical protein